MDALYSGSLLVALVTGGAALGLGVLARWRPPGRMWTRGGIPLLGLGTAALLLSVGVHTRWGHGPASPEPMSAGAFIAAHPSTLIAGALLLAGGILLQTSNRRG